jgi:hypothetical protein
VETEEQIKKKEKETLTLIQNIHDLNYKIEQTKSTENYLSTTLKNYRDYCTKAESALKFSISTIEELQKGLKNNSFFFNSNLLKLFFQQQIPALLPN